MYLFEAYKIITGKYDRLVSPNMTKSVRMSPEEMICGYKKNRSKYDVFKCCFTNRVVNTWNSLPKCVVSANTTNSLTCLKYTG